MYNSDVTQPPRTYSSLRKKNERIVRFSESLIKKGYTVDSVLETCLKIAKSKTALNCYYNPASYLHEYLELDRWKVFRVYFNDNREKAMAHYKIADDMYLSHHIEKTVDYLLFKLKPTSEDEYVLLPHYALHPEMQET